MRSRTGTTTEISWARKAASTLRPARAELQSRQFSSSLFLDAAHKILTDHGGSLLLDPRSHAAFPVIISLPRTYRPEGPLAPAAGG